MKRGLGVLFILGALLLAMPAYAQGQSDAEHWIEQASGRWELILRVPFMEARRTIATSPASDEEREAARQSSQSAYEELERAIDGIQMSVESTEAPPDLGGSHTAAAQLVLTSAQHDQADALHRLHLMNVRLRDTRLAMINGDIPRSVGDPLVLNLVMREIFWIMSQWTRLGAVETTEGSCGSIFVQLVGSDVRVEFLDREAKVTILDRQLSRVPAVQQQAHEIATTLRALAPRFGSACADVHSVVIPEGTMPNGNAIDAARFRDHISEAPDAVRRQADDLDRYANTWSDWSLDTLASDHREPFPPSLLQKFDQLGRAQPHT